VLQQAVVKLGLNESPHRDRDHCMLEVISLVFTGVHITLICLPISSSIMRLCSSNLFMSGTVQVHSRCCRYSLGMVKVWYL